MTTTTLKVTKKKNSPFEEIITITGKNKKEVNTLYVQKYGWMYKKERTTYEYFKNS
jgi:hypothetical protein